ncbi:FecR family protein [Pseudoduganella sp. SL102]|uniref:FecR family protein n=1 Tax=Pseudoduganella sp. SL102 TaxID=2995154 RepID=UPI00248C7384|nr:FecR family protein [Pseudoduganella sp. SL102]WBS01588.1 FecR family protein [Pseudoduganella sp. SL102]
MTNPWSRTTATDTAIGRRPAPAPWCLSPWHVLWLCLLLGCAQLAWAAPVAGVVVRLSGPLLAKKANGAVKILALKSEVENGDTLVTEKNTYAMVKVIDNSEITLRPGSTMTIENFSFAAERPEGDAATFNLVKGGLRSVTGLLGKRSKEKFEMKTPAATIGIRGTTFIAEFVAPPDGAAPALPSGAQPARPPGLYVQVLDGMIFVANGAGGAAFNAGQFGYVPGITRPPQLLPANPGIQFTPPVKFNSPIGPGDSGPGSAAPNSVDCEVR